ncbi:anti-sigma factor [Leucobacter insecticola]|uniref:Regulator of SigK n=1 Tax=Leucobacter insecticola TaxID=2714934 RepID=A0A6G8FJV3_9MICO|nr:anti-sigma factor [Leucobacter insecticola]QIM16631.1 anti-sigma factor [Leucobacter insecticola]
MKLQEFRDLSAGHALGALSPEEEQSFKAVLAARPEWRDIADTDAAVAAELGRSLPVVPPRAQLREQILSAIDLDTQTATEADHPSVDPEPSTAVSRPGSPSRRAWIIGAFALAASVALFSTVMLGSGVLFPPSPEEPAVVALHEVEKSPDAASRTVTIPGGPSVTLHWSNSQGIAVLVAENMAPAAAGEDYELWIVRGDEKKSLGLMKPDDDLRSVFATNAFVAGDVVAVTVEPEGGSPSGLPTTEPVLAITTVL